MVDLRLWDTAGQEQFQSICHLIYRDCSMAVICFSPDQVPLSKADAALSYYVNSVRENSREDTAIVLVATKNDLAIEDQQKEISAFCSNFCAKNKTVLSFFSTSAVTGTGVNELFLWIADNVERGNTVKAIYEDSIAYDAPGIKSEPCC
jgi:GTPase SAR1 family protein